MIWLISDFKGRPDIKASSFGKKVVVIESAINFEEHNEVAS
jgi:hypothetical protein